MRLLIYGINYSPEPTGIGKYTGEMCEWLVEQGHDVDVITALPYYPYWKVMKNYRNNFWKKEKLNGVTVYRSPIYVPLHVTAYTRLIHDFSFLLSSGINWAGVLIKKYDAMVCVYPPLPIGVFPTLFQRLRNIPMIFHIQDLQVDAARQLGMIRREGVLNLLERIEKYFMKRATRITTLSEGMRRKIINKGIHPEKISLFPNWVDTNFLQPLFAHKDELKEKYGYEGWQKVVLYAGNIGEKQGLETVLEVAERLQELGQSYIQFLIVGEGASKKKLLKTVLEKKLDNVRFDRLVPNAQLPELLNMADLHLVLQKKLASDLVMPSKLTGILACGGVPIVSSAKDSSLRNLVETHRFGLSIDPEDTEALLQAIIQADGKDLEECSRHAREYALKYLGKTAVLSQFEEILYQVADYAKMADRPQPIEA